MKLKRQLTERAKDDQEIDDLFNKMDVLLVRVESVADRLIAKLEEMDSKHG